MSNGISRCQEADPETLVDYLYDELAADDRARLEAHLTLCGDCRAELDEMRGVRGQLAAWPVPPWEPGFATVDGQDRGGAGRRRWALPAGLAAAAVLVLAAAAGIANVELRYDGDGVSVRTGWSRAEPVAQSAEAPAPVTPVAAERAADAEPWRDDLAALEERLRTELASAAPAVPAAADRDAARSITDAELLRRVRALIEQSEQRQQRELALRVAQLARDFDSQRQTDLVRIQQGLGQLEGSTAADRQLLNYLVRVSQRQ